MPGGPEGEPGDFVEKVAVGGASPVKDRHEPGTVTGHEHVAVQQVGMQHVADLRTGIQQRREGPFTSDEGLIEAGLPGENRPPAGYPPARPVHEPFQQPFPPAHRDGRAAGGRPNLTRGRHLEMPQVIKPAHRPPARAGHARPPRHSPQGRYCPPRRRNRTGTTHSAIRTSTTLWQRPPAAQAHFPPGPSRPQRSEPPVSAPSAPRGARVWRAEQFPVLGGVPRTCRWAGARDGRTGSRAARRGARPARSPHTHAVRRHRAQRLPGGKRGVRAGRCRQGGLRLGARDLR